MTSFHLCEIGWQLYGAWSDLEEAPAKERSRKAITAAKRAYYQHRMTCEGCTRPDDVMVTALKLRTP